MKAATVFFVLIFVLSGLAQDALIMNTGNRTGYCLNGNWHYLIDLTGDRLNKNLKERFNNDLLGYDWLYADKLYVPGDYNHQKQELFLFEGAVWYQHEFEFSPEPDKVYFIHFGAVENKAVVYINEHKAGTHAGAYTPFNFEITDFLKKGTNFIHVCVKNDRDKEGVPPVNYDWWNYGGITRDVQILELSKVHIVDYHIQLAQNKLDQISGWVSVSKKTPGCPIQIDIPEIDWRCKGVTNAEGRMVFQKKIQGIEYWSPSNPQLYRVTVSSDTDTITDRIGFRTIHVSGNEILLNHEPVFLKGICVHDEIPQKKSRTSSMTDSKILLDWAKELNCNFLRLAHYTHNENTIKLADEMGFLIWAEIPTYWQVDFKSERALQSAKQQLTEMINRDRNRASVIIWSVANETNPGAARQRFLKHLIEHAKSIDGTRLVTAALKKKKVPLNSALQECDDPLMPYVDVISLNEYIGWYPNQGLNGLPADCKQVTWKIPDHKPLIMSEFGAGALYGYHGADTVRWTEEFQQSLYKYTMDMLEPIPNLCGICPWLMADYLSPKRRNTYFQQFWNRKGLISNTGKKKKAFYFLKEYYRQR